ncbi:MAG: hypothetical protein AAF591_02130 [Verrucomicrobiota bacterium]
MKLCSLVVVGLIVGWMWSADCFGQVEDKSGGSKGLTKKEEAAIKQAQREAQKAEKEKAKRENLLSRGKLVFERAALEEVPLVGKVMEFRDEKSHRDFPVATVDGKGRLWVAYVEHDGESDVLWLAKEGGKGLEAAIAVSEPGIIHHPAVATAGDGTTWVIWGQTGEDDVMHLMGRAVNKKGKLQDTRELARTEGSDTFAVAGTDSEGRVWTAWQSMRTGRGQVFCRYFDPGFGGWSAEIVVSENPAAGEEWSWGSWEPSIAFDDEGGAWVLYDSSKGNEFNLYLARIDGAGKVTRQAIAASPKYEARGMITPTGDGSGFWIAAERGREGWGLDNREHKDWNALNAKKRILFGRYDIEEGEFEEIGLGGAEQPIAPGNPVNLPTVGVDADGNPWVAYRYYDTVLWSLALTRYDLETGEWSVPAVMSKSSFGQDRRATFVGGKEGSLRLLWPSDQRTTKTVQVAGVYLAEVDAGAELAVASPDQVPFPEYPEVDHSHLGEITPERAVDDRHEWDFDGEGYGLYWGDVHRHTDVSNCRTGFDGCIVEHFRYAYDMGKLDFLGTSDHTDIGKPYDPYEWWHNQRMADVFNNPGAFHSMYVYEREQKWPWGHRNVVFAERGGPIVYIKRALYRSSPWQDQWPVKAGLDDITPDELWDILGRSGKKVAVISHTGATTMGTDWSQYEEIGIDHRFENVVEIYQGARLSYEGVNVPQPPVAIGRMPLDPEAPLLTEAGRQEFGDKNPGVYQNALAHGHRLGVFTSSDHLSEHVSYGGVYVKDFSREGIIEGLKARRTVAGTDKIYVEFSCNGEILGSMFESADKPVFTIKVDGTAPIGRVTLVRNEEDYEVFGARGKVFEKEYRDEAPLAGENRYYLRVEQLDGNMAWASPVWVEYTGGAGQVAARED